MRPAGPSQAVNLRNMDDKEHNNLFMQFAGDSKEVH